MRQSRGDSNAFLLKSRAFLENFAAKALFPIFGTPFQVKLFKEMIKNWRLLLFPLFLAIPSMAAQPQFFLEPQSSPLIMEVNPVVLLNAAAPTQIQNGGSLSWTGNVATGFGLLTSISISDSRFDVETGAVYMSQLSERNSAGITVTEEMHNIHIPLLLRFNFDERVAIGAGGYMGIAEGSISTKIASSTTYASYNSAGIHDRDFGLLFSARASLMIVPKLYFIIDGRYQHGLSNLVNIPPGTSGDLFNTRSMQAYLGLSYRFMPF